MKIYVASSWRNEKQPYIVKRLREEGFEIYDFKNATKPPYGENIKDVVGGFHWSEIDEDWQKWTPAQFKYSLKHPTAQEGFNRDFVAMEECDATVMIMPCGRSAHLELGWAVGANRKAAILLSATGDGEPELMYDMVDFMTEDLDHLIEWLKVQEKEIEGPRAGLREVAIA